SIFRGRAPERRPFRRDAMYSSKSLRSNQYSDGVIRNNVIAFRRQRRRRGMKGKVLVINGRNNITAYVPVDRLLRIEVRPGTSETPPLVPSVGLYFEGGFKAVLHTPKDPEKAAQDLYERLVKDEDVDLTHLRPDIEKGITDIAFAREHE